MGLTEFGWLLAAKKPKATKHWAGGLTDQDVRELSEEIKVHGW